MEQVIFWAGILGISLFVLVKSSGYFTKAAEKLGLFLGMSPFIIGVVIVGIGTSMPELISSILAVYKGSSEIVIGNVVGSNIANIFLILGVASVLSKRLKFTHDFINIDTSFLVGSTFLLALLAWDLNFSRGDAVISLVGFIIYIVYAATHQKEAVKLEEVHKISPELKKDKFSFSTIFVLLVSSAFIFLGANYTVESIIRISNILNIAKDLIAVSVVALGTSLPEIAVSINAARVNKGEIAVGNILGSNIFNASAVMGIPALMGSLSIPATMINFSIPMMLVATIMFFFVIQKNEITKWEGMILLLFYFYFIGRTFNLL